jgi:hypothetical protein
MPSVQTWTRAAVRTMVQDRLRDEIINTDIREREFLESELNEAINYALNAAAPVGQDELILMDKTTHDTSPQPTRQILKIRMVELVGNTHGVLPLSPADYRVILSPNAARWIEVLNGIETGQSIAIAAVVRFPVPDSDDDLISADLEMVLQYALAYCYEIQLRHNETSDRMKIAEMGREARTQADMRKQLEMIRQYPELQPPKETRKR